MRCAFLTAALLLVASIAVSGTNVSVPVPRYDIDPRYHPVSELSVEYEHREQHGSDRALSRVLTTGDFDEDGTVDLIWAYANTSGAYLAFQRGNVDAIFPHAPEAGERRRSGSFVDQPFLTSVCVFVLPETPDFMEAGDFDADGHRDVVIAAHEGEALYLLRGNGHGVFSETERFEVEGSITAVTGGEIDRPDGLADLVVAVNRTNGPALLIFANPDGALRGAPEQIETSSPVTVLALGQLDDHPAVDLVAIAKTDLLVVQGADRPRSRNQRTPESFRFSESIEAVVVADFVWDLEHRNELTVLTDSGALYSVTLRELRAFTGTGAILTAATDLGGSPPGVRRRLFPVRVTGRPADELLILDGAPLMTVLAHRPADEPTTRSSAWPNTVAKAFVELQTEPVAVETVRLNGDALSDFVVLGHDATAPLILASSPATIFTVNSSGDETDVSRNGVCTTSQGTCTLRAAIQEANFLAGADLITFDLPAGSLTIAPTVVLPAISEAVTIDASTQPGFAGTPIVELDGSSAGSGSSGLFLTGGNVTIRGLVIGNYSSDGIALAGNGNNIIEGNFIGIDATGTTSQANAVIGVSSSTADNTIGGTTVAARNVISGNGFYGVWINSSASQNTVVGNYVGTDVTGTLAVANSIGGVLLTETELNSIGTPDPGGRNVISGNHNGVVINSSGAGTNLVQDNYVGTDATGASPLANASSGVTLSGSSDTVTRNVIAYNLVDGVTVSGATAVGNAIRNNSIFSNTALGIDLGAPGVLPNDPGDPDLGENDLQNYPLLVSAGTTATNITIQGTMNGPAGTDIVLEFFANSACDLSGHGEGEIVLGTTEVATDAMGDAVFSAAFSAAVPVGYAVTATATNSDQSTSEFSACLTVDDCQSTAQVFGQTVFAPDKNTLGWPVAEDVVFVKGDLASVGSYAISDQGPLPGANFLDISADAPGPGTGLYYLVRLQQFCGSWQTALGAEPERDAALP